MIEALYILILMLPLPVLLNRWRGTGAIATIGKFRLIGNIIYALYIAGIVGCAYALTFGGWISVSYGLLAGLLYIAGESFAWGKWVGYLTSEDGALEYDNKTGRSFPYIHYIANSIVDQEMNYRLYCQIALAIRGAIWWLPVLGVMYFANIIPMWLLIVNTIVAGIGFPRACEIGKRWKYAKQSKWLNMSEGWENQEVVYGMIQFVIFTLPILVVLCLNG